MSLPNIKRTTIQNWNNLLYLPGDEELVLPAPLVPPSSHAGLSFSSQQPYLDYGDLGETLTSIQEEQASLRAFVASVHATVRDFV